MMLVEESEGLAARPVIWTVEQAGRRLGTVWRGRDDLGRVRWFARFEATGEIVKGLTSRAAISALRALEAAHG